MKLFVFILLFFLGQQLVAQYNFMSHFTNTNKQFAKAKVKEIEEFEQVNGKEILKHRYFIDANGNPLKHYYYDTNLSNGDYWIEENTASQQIKGLIIYKRAMYTRDGVHKADAQIYEYYYSDTKKLYQTKMQNSADYTDIIIQHYDTTDLLKENKSEFHIYNNDTLRRITDKFDRKTRTHKLEVKKEGKWIEEEFGISEFENEKVINYKLYVKGIINYEWDAQNEKNKNENKIETYENDYGLPPPDPFVDTLYCLNNDFKNLKQCNKKSAKYFIIRYYQNGQGNYLTYYEIYNYKNSLLLMQSNEKGDYYRKLEYIF